MNLVHDKDISNQCIYDGLVIQHNTIYNLRVEKKYLQVELTVLSI